MDGVKIGEVGSGVQDFSVANNPLFVHHKCGTFGHSVHVEYEIIVEGAIGGGGGFVEIAKEREVEVLVLFVFGQGKNRVDADAKDLGIGLVVEGDIVTGAAQFFGAGAGKCLGEEKQEDILAPVVAERYFLFI